MIRDDWIEFGVYNLLDSSDRDLVIPPIHKNGDLGQREGGMMPRKAHKTYSIMGQQEYVCYNGHQVGWCYSPYEGVLSLLCVLLVVVPDAKSDYSNKERVARGEYEHRGITPQSGGTEQERNSNRKTGRKGQIRGLDRVEGK